MAHLSYNKTKHQKHSLQHKGTIVGQIAPQRQKKKALRFFSKPCFSLVAGGGFEPPTFRL